MSRAVRSKGGLLLACVAGWTGLACGVGVLRGTAPAHGAEPIKVAGVGAWTLEEAQRELKFNPRDAYLQYVVLQLARQQGKFQGVLNDVEWRVIRPNRRNEIDVFDVFTGAAAVQESLQLDTLRNFDPREKYVPEPRTVDIATLKGPTIQGHPWKQMLAGKVVQVDELANVVPADQFYVRFRSLTKLLDVMDDGDLWATHLFDQAFREAKSALVGERLKEQLAVETNVLLRPFYDLVVSEVAVTGSDLYLREGTDVALLFRFSQPEVFRTRMDGFLDSAAKQHPGAVRSTGELLGIPFVHVTTPDRSVHVFSAYPRPDLHVRANSETGLRRVLESVVGKDAQGRKAETLGGLDEFAYIRTLMPAGAPEEDGLVYLSDPFIRDIVGPRLKLGEVRRLECTNHLAMIGHAALLHRTQTGRAAKTLGDLAESKSAPGLFGEGELSCREGGTYALNGDGLTATCSVHGRVHAMRPLCEQEINAVSPTEAKRYEGFLREYESYWRTFFDPIAVRIQVRPKSYRVETLILPLIDNSLYRGLSTALSGTPEPLDDVPLSPRTIFSTNFRVNRELTAQPAPGLVGGLLGGLGRNADEAVDTQALEAATKDFLERGIGNQVGFHVCDGEPPFDLNLSRILAETTVARGNVVGRSEFGIAFLIASLNTPVYVAVPLKDAALADRFLDEADKVAGQIGRRQEQQGFFAVEPDFYLLKRKDRPTIRCQSVRFGPIKWRFFWGRIGNVLYVASQPSILDDLEQAAAAPVATGKDVPPRDPGPTAHAMIRMRPENWNRMLPNLKLGWAENNRAACVANHAQLSAVARALIRSSDKPELDGTELGRRTLRTADLLTGAHAFCPDGGHYHILPDGRRVACSVHGHEALTVQGSGPNEKAPLGRLVSDVKRITAALTFEEHGLHAVLTIERK